MKFPAPDSQREGDPTVLVPLPGAAVPVLFRTATLFRAERLGADAAWSLTCAAMACLASLPGCEMAEWLPCPDELPEVGLC